MEVIVLGITNTRQARAYVGGSSEPGRPGADFYETPPEATRCLLRCEPGLRDGAVWEPACGAGAISTILETAGIPVVSSDLFDYDYGTSGVDFLHAPIPDGVRSIVTNPPFSIAEQFATRCDQVVRETGGIACLLQRLAWLEGAKRRQLFEETCLARVWVFSRRIPMMHRPGWTGMRSSSIIGFAWFVWDPRHRGYARLGWVDWREMLAPPTGQLVLEEG